MQVGEEGKAAIAKRAMRGRKGETGNGKEERRERDEQESRSRGITSSRLCIYCRAKLSVHTAHGNHQPGGTCVINGPE